jgi:hypothetical protein
VGADADEGLESEKLLDSQGCQVKNVPWYSVPNSLSPLREKTL